MPDIGTWLIQHWDSAEHSVTEHIPHREPQPGEHPYAETPAPAVTTETTQEDDMSKLADELHAFAARVDKFDDDVLNDVEAIQANPVTARAFARLRTLTGISASPIFDAAVGLLEAVPQAVAAPVEVAAGPQA